MDDTSERQEEPHRSDVKGLHMRKQRQKLEESQVDEVEVNIRLAR